MGNEPSNDPLIIDEGKHLERPASVDALDERVSDLKEDGLTKPDEVAPENTAETAWLPEPADAEPGLVIVDPYTAAPRPTTFSETASPFEEVATGGREPWEDHVTPDDPFIPLPYSPTSQGESIRRSGLAWSAGIAFFGSVAFTLFLGWIADILLGISPWGIIGGIIFGSVIGFVQFFRITSRIFPSRNDGPEITPLMPRKDDE